jgi:hypothetical protein
MKPNAKAAPPAAPASSPFPWKTAALLSGLFLAALVIRLIALGRPALWQDEMLFVNTMSNPRLTLGALLQQYWEFTLPSMGQMPLAGVIQNLWTRFWADADITLTIARPLLMRVPAAFFGSLAVPGFFLLARRVLSATATWCATLMMLVFFFPVYYSREVYCYPPLLCLSTWGFYFLVRAMETPGRTVWWSTGLIICLTGAAYCHLAGTMMAAVLAGITGIFWIWHWTRKNTAPAPRRMFAVTLACGAAFLAAAPFLIHYVASKPPHLANPVLTPIPVILNDALSKFFFGEPTAATGLAWAGALIGAASFLFTRSHQPARRILALAAIGGFGVLAAATHKSQYISARYLSPLLPLCYLLFAQGLETVAAALGRKSPETARRILMILAGAALAVHLAVYLPLLYRMKNKSQDFKSIADWINQNVQPGNPYLMESAYELRMVGGFHPTPDRVGASPYVHGGGFEEMQRLHTAQREFLMDFPAAPFIESAHHNFGTTNYWTWPRTFFKQQARLRDEPLRRLARMGILPMEPHPDVNEAMYTTDIYYNRPEDLDTVARENGWPAVFQYPEWRCVALEQTPQGNARYGRMHPGNRGRITVKGIAPSQSGCFQADAALIAPAGSYSCALLWKGQPVGTFAMQPSRLMTITSRAVELTNADGDLQWAATGATAQQVQALAIAHLRFIPVTGEMQPPAAADKK